MDLCFSSRGFQDGAVDLTKLLFRVLVFDAQHNAIGVEEILHGRALAQKFRIGGHAEFHGGVSAVNAEHALQLLSRLGGHRAFLDDQF